MMKTGWILAKSFAISFALVANVAPPAFGADMSFEEIMESVAAQGSISNGDGHRWSFRKKSDGMWEVEGARGETAKVTSDGAAAIRIDGFPANWNANGRFKFSAADGKCQLKSDHSGHRLKWDC